LEYDHTFSNASFLRVGFFQRNLNQSVSGVFGSTGQFADDVRYRGVRVRYEGALSSVLTFFTGLDLNDAEGKIKTVNRDLTPAVVRGRLTQVPRVAAEIGLQYLNRDGYFVQGSLAYIGSRPRDVNLFQPSRGSYNSAALANLRAGRRLGLRYSAFVEVVNLFDEEFVGGSLLQPGRQLRIGAVSRF
jgi:outer membrane receptor protein involved in Fe transport